MLETQPWNKAASGASRKVAMARKAENSCNCQEMIKHQHQDASQHKSQLLNNFFGICSEWLNSWRGATPAPSLEVAVSSSVSINLLSEFLGTLGGTAAVAALGCCASGVGARLCGRLGHPGAQRPWTGDRGRCLACDATGEHSVPEPVWVLHLHLGLPLHRGWGGPAGRFLREGTFPTGFNAEHRCFQSS